jgi:hypothetical protein
MICNQLRATAYDIERRRAQYDRARVTASGSVKLRRIRGKAESWSRDPRIGGTLDLAMSNKDERLKTRFIALVEKVRATPLPQGYGPFKVLVRFPQLPDVRLVADTGDLYNEVLGGFLRMYASGESSVLSAKELEDRFARTVQRILGRRGQGQKKRTRAFATRLRRETAALLASLREAPVDWRVYVPLTAPKVSQKVRFGRVELVRAVPRASNRSAVLFPTSTRHSTQKR